MKQASLYDWLALWVLRRAKARRKKYVRQQSREFYEHFFTKHDAVACTRDLRRICRDGEVQRVIDRLPSSALVLDVGCGMGDVLARLKSEPRRVGMDYALPSLRAAQHNGLHSVPLVNGSITALPFADHSVDAIICLEVLEHIEDDRAAVAEITRVLKKDGILVASVPNAFYFDDYLPLMGHWRHYSAGEMRDLLASGSLRVRADLCMFPRLNRVSFYVYGVLWVINALRRKVFAQQGTLYDMRLPMSRRSIYDMLVPHLTKIAERDKNAPRLAGTFVEAVKQ